MRRLLTVICATASLLFVACAPKRVDPSTHQSLPRSAAFDAATQYAAKIGGVVYHVSCCGSMVPLIHDGDYVVSVPRILSDDLLGHVVIYRPNWHPSSPVVHRLVGSYSSGYIGEGDARIGSNGKPILPETSEPITQSIFIGEVVAIYPVQL